MVKQALTNKKINDRISEVVGIDAIPIIEFLKDKKNVSEFIIAEKIKYDMQKTRHLLYKLNNFNIAGYIRRKDRQKGWYISYWTFDRKKVKELVDKLRREKIDKLYEQLKKEEDNKGSFFICTKACSRLDFDQATEFEFKCPECGNLLNQEDNRKIIGEIERSISALEKEAKQKQ